MKYLHLRIVELLQENKISKRESVKTWIFNEEILIDIVGTIFKE